MGVRLPVEYQEVEYLQSDGYQYFYSDIDIQDGLTVDSVQSYNGNGDMYLFGGSMDNGRSVFNGGYLYQIQGAYPSGYYLADNGLNKTINAVYHIVTTHANGTITVYRDGNLIRNTSGLASIEADGSKCAVFGQRPVAGGTPDYRYIGGVYSLKVSKNATMLADYVPCYRKSDNKPGMYDLVRHKFYINEGIGEFRVGPDVIGSISPLMVAWRRMLMKKQAEQEELYPIGTDVALLYIGGTSNKKNFVVGMTIESGNGNYVESAPAKRAASPEYIEVNPSYRYHKSSDGRLYGWAWYDANKEFISYFQHADLDEWDMPAPPSNARYARMATFDVTNNWGIKIIRIA